MRTMLQPAKKGVGWGRRVKRCRGRKQHPAGKRARMLRA